MTAEEFSNEFNVLIWNYRQKHILSENSPVNAFSFDEYEKSAYLTSAQEEFLISLYTGRTNLGEGFENKEEIRRYLSTLIKEATLNKITNTSGNYIGIEGSKSQFFTLPSDALFITYESITVTAGKCGTEDTQNVYPVTQDEYHKIKKNPFRGATNRRALRLDLADGVIEIISKYAIKNYYLRYIRKVDPIILVNLPNDLSINGKSTITSKGSDNSGSELHPYLHRKILELAVMKALQSRGLLNSKSDN